MLGIHPEVVPVGRRTNDAMGASVARERLRMILKLGRANPAEGGAALDLKGVLPRGETHPNIALWRP